MRNSFLISLLILLQVTTLSISGQQNVFKIYTVSDGLVNNSIRRVFQDSKGFLWIATWEGLSKYDGNRFTNFTEANGLSHNMVNDVIETGDGDIYVAMNNGSVDVIKNDKVAQKEVIRNIVINRLYLTEKKKLLALTDNAGIIEINEKKIKQLTPVSNDAIYGMVALNDSLMAAAALSFPLFIYDQNFQMRAFIRAKLDNSIPNCIYKDLQNRLWLGTSKGLKLISIGNQKNEVKFDKLPPHFNDPLLSQAIVTSILQQKNGTFWIGTEEGLINITPDGRLLQLTEKDGLPSRVISNLFDDRENNLWVGTAMGLVKIIAPSPVAIPDRSQSQPKSALLFKKISPQQLLIASNGFFYRWNFLTGERENIMQLEKDKDVVYVKSSSPPLFIYNKQLLLYDFNSNRLRFLNKVPVPDNFLTATTTNNKTIFIGLNGITIWLKGKVIQDTFFRFRITNILADQKGYVWIGTWADGLYRARFDETSKSWRQSIQFTQLPDNHIRSLFEDHDGNMWVGTRYSGVVRIKEKRQNEFEFTHLDQQSGLSSNWIRDATVDEKGNIWLATMSGIDKLIKQHDRYDIFNYSRIINFHSNNTLVTYITGNKLLFSTVQGIFQITDKQLEQYPAKQVYLTRVTLADSTIRDLSLKNISTKNILPYSKNHVLFEFTSPTFINEKEILYSYRLKGGADSSWSLPSNSHSVQYASLEPGHYRFEVRMRGWNGKFGPVTSFLFIVKPPYWNTWWFYSGIVLVVLLAAYSLYRYRINHLLRLQKVRNTIATDLHDDIGSTLTNISILSELGKKNLQEPPVAEKYLHRITEESAATQQALDDIIWSVNTGNDNMQELQARMRRYAGELFESSNITCQFNFEKTSEDNKLNMEQRRDVYLVFKECLNNIHKHASAKNTYIKIAFSNSVLNMLIEDDGKGFDPNITTHRNGLKNLETRVKKWNGDLKIDTTAGKGTRIEIRMAIKNSLLK